MHLIHIHVLALLRLLVYGNKVVRFQVLTAAS
jgi:hypothetical protein